MKKRLSRIIAAMGVVLALAAIGTVAAAPAQAHAPITYTADCPTNSLGEEATWQQLVTQNWSGSIISATAWEYYPNGNIIPIGSTASGQTGGQVTWFTPADGDVVQYTITSPGTLNYFYHVDCFY